MSIAHPSTRIFRAPPLPTTTVFEFATTAAGTGGVAAGFTNSCSWLKAIHIKPSALLAHKPARLVQTPGAILAPEVGDELHPTFVVYGHSRFTAHDLQAFPGRLIGQIQGRRACPWMPARQQIGDIPTHEGRIPRAHQRFGGFRQARAGQRRAATPGKGEAGTALAGHISMHINPNLNAPLYCHPLSILPGYLSGGKPSVE